MSYRIFCTKEYIRPYCLATLLSGFVLIGTTLQTLAQTNSSCFTPAAILSQMQRVADWQLAHPVTNRPTGWICAVGDIGMMAMADVSSDPKYREAMLAKGETNNWELPAYRGRKYHADDQCIGQVWTELYFFYRKNGMVAPMRAKMDFILSNPPPNQNLEIDTPTGQETWSWCDALFMAPPAWLRLSAATDDKRYMNFAVSNFWRTADFLYDTNSHLFFRDNTFFDKREANGQKIFWSRGNGWVLAALARMLEYLPENHPDRPRFEQLFKVMSEKIVACQQPDGMWRASLLDPQDYPMPESSGSALFVYSLAWGVNHRLLDREKYGPAIRKGWVALANCVAADGELTHVQAAGSGPAQFAENSTAPYGNGAFLLAGSEVYRMAGLKNTKPVMVNAKAPSVSQQAAQ
ncbi:MAG TPA: glycoside hydrolase family 88 protein [Pseudomonadales bacterium]|nr:glycoside hydrolase family 88 protein [Pseudomonadales bacterium]